VRTVTALLMAIALPLAAPAAQAPTGTPPATATPLFAAVFTAGPKWDPAKPPGEQPFFREHSANLAKLRAAGRVVMGARYAEVGLVVVNASSETDARRLFEADPSIAAGTFSVNVHRFSVFYPGMVGTPPVPK
jgi:hypothetical protein